MKWLRITLQVIGALSLLVVATAGPWLAYNLHKETSERINVAKPKDALFILNWGGIPTNQNFKVIASYQSQQSLTGDHLDYYCIELLKFEVADFAKEEWRDGPETNPLLAEALELAVNDARQYADCFPSFEEANSPAMKAMFWSMVTHGRQPSAADIILYDPKSKRLYYVSYKT